MVIVIDGKTVRGTITAKDPFGLHLLAAYLPGDGIVLMQMVVEKDKENEIVVAPKLLQCLDLRHKVIVGDAMHTQRQISSQIVEAGGTLFGSSKITRPIPAKPLNSSLLLKSQCLAKVAQRWISKVLKQLKSKLDGSKLAKSPSAA